MKLSHKKKTKSALICTLICAVSLVLPAGMLLRPPEARELCFFADSLSEARQTALASGGSLLWWESGIGVMNAAAPAKTVAVYEDSWLFSETDQTQETAEPTQTEGEIPLPGPMEWHLEAIHAPEAWKTAQGEGVLVAVIDTGIDPTHPEFSHCLTGAETVIPESAYREGGYFRSDYQGPVDHLGHGTHIAGLIAARADGSGSSGAAPLCRIFSIKALESDGVRGNGKTSWVVAAIGRAVDAGADIINMSIGGAMQENDLLWEAIRRANEAGVLVVCAAGNTGTSAKCYPAAYPETLAVSAVRRQADACVIASYSNYGDWIDLCAPGSNLYGPTLEGEYNIMTGTSMACPLVSAGAALLLSRDPLLTPRQLQQLLLEAAEDLGAKGKDDRYGAGLLNLDKALTLLQERTRLCPPVSDCPDGSILTDETPVQWKTDDLHGRIYYTLDGTDPSGESLLWPEDGRCFPAGPVELKIAVCHDGRTGESLTVRYTVVPAQAYIPETAGTETYPVPTYGSREKRLQLVIPEKNQIKCTLTGTGKTAELALYDENGGLLASGKNGTLTWKNKTSHPVAGLLKITPEQTSEFTLQWKCSVPAAPAPAPTQRPTAPPAPTTQPTQTTAPTVPTTVQTLPPETTVQTHPSTEATPPQTTAEEPLFQVELVTNEETQTAVTLPPEADRRKPEGSLWILVLPAIAAGFLLIGKRMENRRKDE